MKLSASATYRPRSDTGHFIQTTITPGCIAAVDASSRMVLAEAQANVAVDTGELRESGRIIPAQQVRNTVSGSVVFTSGHAGFVEFGTGIRGSASPGAAKETPGFHWPYSPTWPGMPAQPYLRPALDIVRETIKGLFRSMVALGGPRV